MAEFTPVTRFLGCTFERINMRTGLPDPKGKVVLVRQREKIMEMKAKFQILHDHFNPTNKARIVPVPVSAIRMDNTLTEAQVARLGDSGIAEYQSIVGCIGWISGSSRPDCRLAYFLLATHLSKPRMWDMYLAVFTMDYLVGTVETPLVLGGEVVDPQVFADASFATLEERRSVIGHLVTSGPRSGAIYVRVGSTKCAVTSIWEAELIAGSDGVDSALFSTKVCHELGYPVESVRNVWVDNDAEIDWINGSVPSKHSRHVDIRLYRCRHMQEQGEVRVQYVPTADNVADILTKPLAAPLFHKLARMILGHCLIQGLGVKGVFEE
jgi:hypothetical protein